MLDSKLLHDLIVHPEKATIEQALLVHELVVKYPFFQAARVLHLKLLSISDYPAFVKQLPYAATYAGDRKKLFYYINPQKKQAAPITQEDAPPLKAQNEVISETPEPVTLVVTDVKENLDQNAELVSDDLVKKKAVQSETFSFAQWLDSMAEPRLEQSKIIEAKSEPGIEEEATPTQIETGNSNIGLTNERWSLIDSFLQEYKPSLAKKDSSEKKPEKEVIDLSSQKSIEDKEIITETLAQIFLAQKNYEKAIGIFEKLSLKYPEKNVYFADLIKKARKQKKKELKKVK